jgi:hypothetical protein
MADERARRELAKSRHGGAIVRAVVAGPAILGYLMSANDHKVAAPSSSPAGGNGAPKFCLPHRGYVAHQTTDPELLARLEWLDDLMFAAIDGDPVALEKSIDAWRKSLNELGQNALEESRQQYLRRAQSVWHELRRQPNHPPHKVFAAIEVISLLAGKAW